MRVNSVSGFRYVTLQQQSSHFCRSGQNVLIVECRPCLSKSRPAILFTW